MREMHAPVKIGRGGERQGGYFWCFVRNALISENSQKEVAIDKKKRKMRLNISGKFKGWWTPAQVKAECT